jgi:alkylation response protein AidB-like acyl-CoA dehydrogenase
MTVIQKNSLIERAKDLAKNVLAVNAADIDRERRFPAENFEALKNAGLMGLFVPKEFGGHEANFETFTAIMEILGEACASTAMCYLMHNCGTAVLARYAQGEQRERVLKPIAKGEKIATLAFSETANGSHFYQPTIQAVRYGDSYLLNGKKSFVTNGNHADYYLVVAQSSKEQEGLNIFIVEKNTENLSFSGEWEGIGMSGNSSIVMEFSDSPVPEGNLLGKEGSGLGVIFDFVAPVFIAGISAVNVGIARAALHCAIEHSKKRTHKNTDAAIGSYQAIQMYLADMFTEVDAASVYVNKTASLIDSADPNALLSILSTKTLACETVKNVTGTAMQVCGGIGFTKSLPVERHFRDGHAGSVMAPTTEVLKTWIGKSLVGLPLL